eukprot:7833836-Ditylum_brightwellii.AAC.1
MRGGCSRQRSADTCAGPTLGGSSRQAAVGRSWWTAGRHDVLDFDSELGCTTGATTWAAESLSLWMLGSPRPRR